MATNQITTNPNSANAAYFIALANLRREAAREVLRLLDFLDRIDGDWDLEDTGDEHEPSLGSTVHAAYAGNTDDREREEGL